MTFPFITPGSVSTLNEDGITPNPGIFNITLGSPQAGRMVVIAYMGADIGGTFDDIFVAELTLGAATITNGQIIQQGVSAFGRKGFGQRLIDIYAIPNANLPSTPGSYPITLLMTPVSGSNFQAVAFELTGCPSENFSFKISDGDNATRIPGTFLGANIFNNDGQSLTFQFSVLGHTTDLGAPIPVPTYARIRVADMLSNSFSSSLVQYDLTPCPVFEVMQVAVDVETFYQTTSVITFSGATVPPQSNAQGPYSGILNQAINIVGTRQIGTDPAPTILWTVVSGGLNSFSNDTLLDTFFFGEQVGTYVLRLNITPCDGPAVTSDVNVVVSDIPPTADPGGPYTGEVNTPTLLNATVTPGTDLNPVIIWLIESGGTGVFSNTNIEDPTFTPAAVGTYVLRISANPNDGPAVINNVVFESTATPDVPPVVDAGGPYTGGAGELTFLNGSLIFGTVPVALLWTIASGGAGTFTGPANPTTYFRPDNVGPYVLTLTATPVDASPPVADTADFDAIAVPPAASAGGPYVVTATIGGPLAGLLDPGSDPNPGILWSVDGSSAGGGIFDDPTKLNAFFTPDTVGAYIMVLTITPNDNGPLVLPAQLASRFIDPQVDAGGPYISVVNTPEALNATIILGTDQAPALLWEIASGGSGIFSDVTDPQATFTPDVVAKYVLRFTLTPNDTNPVSDTASFDSRQVIVTTSKQHNDLKQAALGGATLADGLIAFLLANGATSGNLTDATTEFLLARGVPMGRKNDMWVAFLTNIPSLPLTGHITEMKRQWWSSGAPLI